MLQDSVRKYSFLDRKGNPLDLGRQKAMDQYGNEHGADFSKLTSIIIISAERGQETIRCVESIYENTSKPFEIILSDAGSSKDTIHMIAALEDKYGNVHVIYNRQSTGTTGQRNQGAYYSKGDCLVFMDNDVLALSGWLGQLKQTAEHRKDIAMVGTKLLRTDAQTVYYCGAHTVTLERKGKVYGIGLNKEGRLSNLRKDEMIVMKTGEVPWYTTTSLLVKRKAFFAVDGFDDISNGKGIFIANEDKDLSLKIRKSGYKIFYCPQAEAIHNHDYSKVDRNDAYHSRYRLRMEQIEKDTRYFLNKWDITYLIEKLPHEDNTSMWNGEKLERVRLDLDSDAIQNDLVTMGSFDA